MSREAEILEDLLKVAAVLDAIRDICDTSNLSDEIKIHTIRDSIKNFAQEEGVNL